MKSKRLITELNEKSTLSETYCKLRTNIKFSNRDNSIKLINVTSPERFDGTSTTCANLALTYANLGERVLLIDADLRNPSQHLLFDLSNSKGLTNVILFKESLCEVIHSINSQLDVLTTGPLPMNPIELISSSIFQNFLESIREKYDFIIIDTPPVGVLTDAAILAAYCDGTLLVVATSKTKINLTKHAKDVLQQINANIIGTVMTMMPTKTKEYQCYVQTYEEDMTLRKKKWWKRRKRGIQA